MPRYLKRYWSEGRGDEYDAWGTSWWFFELDDNDRVVRQAELYEVGRLLRYSAEHAEDEFGALAEIPGGMPDGDYVAISREEFEAIWNRP
jgi:hypothetical protein